MRLLLVLLLCNITTSIFYTKIIYTPVYLDKFFNHHHIVLLQKYPFIKNQTEYNNIYAVDFVPCGNLFEIILGKELEGLVRISYIKKSNICNIYKNIKEYHKLYHTKNNIKNLDKIKDIDINIYNKIQNWKLTFQLYKNNCQHFANNLTNNF